jgi:hypothetical protein
MEDSMSRVIFTANGKHGKAFEEFEGVKAAANIEKELLHLFRFTGIRSLKVKYEDRNTGNVTNITCRRTPGGLEGFEESVQRLITRPKVTYRDGNGMAAVDDQNGQSVNMGESQRQNQLRYDYDKIMSKKNIDYLDKGKLTDICKSLGIDMPKHFPQVKKKK